MKILEKKNQKIAAIKSDEIVIKTPQDALDVMAEATYYEAKNLILREENLSPAFFDLRTKVVEFGKYKSERLKAFIRESNRGEQIFFVGDREAAIEKRIG